MAPGLIRLMKAVQQLNLRMGSARVHLPLSVNTFSIWRKAAIVETLGHAIFVFAKPKGREDLPGLYTKTGDDVDHPRHYPT